MSASIRIIASAALAVFVSLSAFAAEPTALVGRRDLKIHDPATPIFANGTWWLFGTGKLVLTARSTDLVHWEKQPSALKAAPPWAKDVAPTNTGSHFWAPDIIKHDGRYLLYYSVSEFGRNSSAIALATSPTLDPTSPKYAWTDQGIVIRSKPVDNFNAIDSSTIVDADGKMWMALGSFWSGIFLIELNPKTGLRIAPDSPRHRLAAAKEIEAPTLYRRNEYYYLFFNEGLCCRGKNSTYRIRVGRSRTVTGPYVDDQGRVLTEGGGRAFLATKGEFIGPGHAGLFRDADGTEWASVHFYDGAHNGAPTLGLRRINWTADGWPQVID